MARNRASMREGPSRSSSVRRRRPSGNRSRSRSRATERRSPPEEPQEKTVEHVPDFAKEAPLAAALRPSPHSLRHRR